MLGGGGVVSHPLQLTTGLVVNSFVITSPTLAGEHMPLIPKVSILSEQTKIVNKDASIGGKDCQYWQEKTPILAENARNVLV